MPIKFRVAKLLVAVVSTLVGLGLSACASTHGTAVGAGSSALADPLSTWRDLPPKRAILDFVNRVTEPGSPDFIPAEDRLATFDFDGTIGCEKPDYMEVMVAMQRLCELTKTEPDLLSQSLYRAACDQDFETVNSGVEEALLGAFEGRSQDFYLDYVETFLESARHPRFDRPYGELYYVPMRQLIDVLHAQDFEVHLVSGSQQGFTRSYGTEILGIPARRAIGHTVELDFSVSDGKSTFLRQDAFLPPSIDGKGKAEVIRNRIGRQPVLAFGNSMGDFEMLQYATTGTYPGLALILVHDDPDEYVYSAPKLVQHANELGWQVVSMKENFEVIFPPTSP